MFQSHKATNPGNRIMRNCRCDSSLARCLSVAAAGTDWARCWLLQSSVV